ncbi:putative LRR receptor-like serine/threonine-protein kinase [Cocos nucifera]|uniref:Putative LRR receptor-like serine/threonine-protein kinase n=1 Tax=Cocos nucifera TaxID=13894 RepID=A0A8K0HW01_COCNU|nr:putative LRR receptor-like serine/threonine-protein kinase [Cocos nucifera]
MGMGFVASFLTVVMLLKCSTAQQPNTDEFFVADFIRKMGVEVASLSDGSSSSVCSWKMVLCDDRKEKVIALLASGVGLSGPIPENTIGKLSMLQTLDLSGNKITGFSSDIWGLGRSLRSLNLSSNQIKGSLPNNLGNFGELESLDLSDNGFSGEMPGALGSLSSLRFLSFHGNRFEGIIPHSFLGCRSLVSIDLSSNRLNGTVPDGFSDALKSLRFLDLSGNEINGKLPDLSGLHSITYLNLSGNSLQGSVLGVFREPMQVIDLSNNQFQGHISQVNISSSYNWSSLVYLDLSVNEISGEFFGDLGRASSLRHLNLAFNRFSHQNFPKLEQLSGLEYLNLSKTSLTGQISTEISKLVSLKTLDLSHNHITGHIPDLSIKNIQVLDLSMNNLTGEIPAPLLDKLANMISFNFSYNNLTLCAAKFSPQTFNTAFIGSQNDCPIAANPDLIRTKGAKHKGLELALAITLSVFFLITGLVCLAFGFQKRTRSWAVKQLSYKEEPTVSGPFSFQTDSSTWVADVKSATSVPVVIFEKPLLNFTFADLLTATSHFDRGTLLAEGKFGPVYRGFLPGGIHVAVKVLVHGSTVTEQEAAKELERLGRIKHPNLVPLTGYCLAGDQRIAIYDYMENGNLQNLLHDLPLGVQATEDWSTDTWEEDTETIRNITTEGMTTWRFRHKIALGAARALAFLHHGCYPQIVHRDVKASSIYLDSALEPRLSDFGLSRIVGASFEDEISRGSPGYVPPEFSESENVSATTKSDVYGFGVVLFELITGKKPLGDDYREERETTLVSWARTLVRKNQASTVIDPKIRETGLETQMEEALRIAYLCTADLPSKRPSMQQIVGLLKDIEPKAADH